MEIVGDVYKLTPVNEHAIFFDLDLLYHIKGKNARDEFKNAGYALPLETAIKKIISYKVQNKLGETATLKEFLEEWKKYQEEIKKECGL